MKIEYYGTVTEEGLKITNRKRFDEELKQFVGKEVEVVVQKKKKSRSAQQNRYYWACVTIVGNELGYEREEMHEIIKYRFLKRSDVNEKTGEVFEYLKSTTELTTTEFMDFMNDFVRWSAEQFNISLPSPNEQLILPHQ